MEHILGKEWTVTPAGGSTGEAYYAKSEKNRLFLKRNSSPFLAVLSAQGIVPKLVWTKRLENGDVVTAQQWLEGKELSPEEMQHPEVAKLLSKIHHSSELLDMLMRIGKKPLKPIEILTNLKQTVRVNGAFMQLEVHQAIKILEKMLPMVYHNKQVVCHCDMNHNNWLLSQNGQLYLIDWDNALIGDPAMDIGMILQWYIPEEDWDYWLTCYGTELDEHLVDRMHWYLMIDSINYFIWHTNRKEYKEAAQQLLQLKRLIKRVTL
ncbi:phosphotransferase family protein [Aquibacillus koreensis]|uniref:Phosphotransferase family protein n=1 Tax=Aquibacillus koreensis TaxID=279446 RepID=A0A9X4AIH8_9BACI|nr:phosphotransferase family protein [Aquibacillus koreensis]MCT2535031.1 phosphotransferase family protein [Aquibacillus koreensis]MDC3419318.1 phosphotransferase family protein [Aquibacillus koreensis]